MAILPLDLEFDIPQNWTPLEVVSVVKCLDTNGQEALCVRQSGGLSAWDALGMLITAGDQVRESLKSDFREHQEGD